MKYLIMFCIPFLTTILICVFWSVSRNNARKKESKMNINDFVICHSSRWTILMVIISALLIALLVILNIRNNSNQFINIFFTALVVFFLSSAYLTSRENIAVKNDNIIYTSVFGKTVHYQFSDITKIELIRYSNGLVLYWVHSNKRIFVLDSSNAGTNLFLRRVKQLGITIE